MQKIANEAFNDYIEELDSISQLNIIKNNAPELIEITKEYNIYSWQKIISFNDTAILDIYVYRNTFNIYKYDIITTNKWNYLLKSNNLDSLVKISTSISNSKKEDISIDIDTNNSILLLPQEKIKSCIQNGHFIIHYISKKNSVVEFWEPIAVKDSLKTNGAKICINDNLKISIIPYNLPDSIIDYRSRYPNKFVTH